jgi:hypothetical protein
MVRHGNYYWAQRHNRWVQHISSTVSIAWSSSILIFTTVIASSPTKFPASQALHFAGNGTQSIVWQINEETYRLTLESEHANANDSQKPGLQIYYGSLHDILSYPCEVRRSVTHLAICSQLWRKDGKLELVQAASVSIHGSHGQHIENIHLQPYASEDHFWNVLYKKTYCKILTKAEEFLRQSGSVEDTLILIRSGRCRLLGFSHFCLKSISQLWL